AFQMRRAREMTQRDHLECNDSVQTFLPSAVDHTLSTASDFFKQLVITELHHWRRSAIRISFGNCCVLVVQRTQRGFQKTSAANFCCPDKLSAALATSSNDNGAHRRSPVVLPLPTAENSVTGYCRSIAIKCRNSSSMSPGAATV